MVNSDSLHSIFIKAIDGLNLQPGALSRAREHDPALAQELDRKSEELEAVWHQVVQGKATEEDFRKRLIEWYRVYKRAAALGGDMQENP